MTRFLVTGASGMLGRDLQSALADRDVTALSRSELDIADESAALSLWGEQIEAMKQRLLDAIQVITGIDESAIASANRKLDALRAEAETVDRGINERDQRLQNRIAERMTLLAEAERDAVDSLAARLAEIDAAIAERREAHIEQTDRLGQQGEAVAQRLIDLRADVEQVGQLGFEPCEAV